jgi:aspartate dehydrogenase
MTGKPVAFGLVGCGAMGATIARAFDNDEIMGNLIAVYDANHEAAKNLANRLKRKPHVAKDFASMLESCDFVIEAASQEAVREYAPKAVSCGKDVLIMSVGALLDKKLFSTLTAEAEKSGSNIYLPSGAVSGIDGLLAASVAGIDEVTLTSTKPPAGLKGNKYLDDKGIDLGAIKVPTVVYEGDAREAVSLFPKNINVSAIVSLACGKTAKVRIIADPNTKRNTHEIRARGRFGELTTITSNVPSPDNPKTSYLACLAAIALLKKVTSRVRMGT